MAASYGLLSALGLDSATKLTDDEVYYQVEPGLVYDDRGSPATSRKPADYTVTAAEITALQNAKSRDALTEIVSYARQTRVVILDEDHLVPRSRGFALEVAGALQSNLGAGAWP